MTNEEYVIEKFKEKYEYLDNLMELLCPSEFEESLPEISECNGECNKCWELEVSEKVSI